MKGMCLLPFGYMTPLSHITHTPNKYRKQTKKNPCECEETINTPKSNPFL